MNSYTPTQHPDEMVAVFNGGCSAFIVDDHCYVLKNWNGDAWKNSAHIFREAAEILRTLPVNPDEAALAVRKFILIEGLKE